jgi:hypothetical protein
VVRGTADAPQIRHRLVSYLIIYNRRTGDNDVREFPADCGREAIRARFEQERIHRGDPNIEVVVLSSSSREELLKTHSR